jgi:cytochrome P450
LLLNNAGQLAAITADPATVPSAVEELLRYFSPADAALLRVAAEDVEIGGVTIRAEEGGVHLGPVGELGSLALPLALASAIA